MGRIDYGYGVGVWSGAAAPAHRIASLTDPGDGRSSTGSRNAVSHGAGDVQSWCIYAKAQITCSLQGQALFEKVWRGTSY